MMKSIVFMVSQLNENEGWYTAEASGKDFFIVTEAKNLDNLKEKIEDALICQFDEIIPYDMLVKPSIAH
ncbi:MAG: hypothetical protein IEMM0008_0668 [bacterium]|nr:MAG: hypothetical protein IEMM0008_0668 [bacterium]